MLNDAIPPERLQHDDFERIAMAHSASKIVTVNRIITQRKIDRYLAHGRISATQHRAGYMLFADWRNGAMEQRVTVNLLGVGGGSAEPGLPATERAMDARRRYRAAIDSLPVAIQNHIINVVCIDVGVVTSRRQLAPRRDASGRFIKLPGRHPIGMELLKVGLDRLADHYGID